MKVSGGIGYTSGALYKRHKLTAYTPGSKYARFGKLGLAAPRNLSAMNREAVASYNSSFGVAGPNMFAQNLTQSEGLSEIAANKVLARVKEQMTKLADSASGVSLTNGGTGGTSKTGDDASNAGDDTTGANVDETV